MLRPTNDPPKHTQPWQFNLYMEHSERLTITVKSEAMTTTYSDMIASITTPVGKRMAPVFEHLVSSAGWEVQEVQFCGRKQAGGSAQSLKLSTCCSSSTCLPSNGVCEHSASCPAAMTAACPLHSALIRSYPLELNRNKPLLP